MMNRSLKHTFLAKGLAILLSCAVLMQTTPVIAGDWTVVGTGDGATLSQDKDDGPDFDAEISLTIQWSHVDEERGFLTQLTTIGHLDHNWDTAGTTMSGMLKTFETVECDDGDWIFVNIRLDESDLLGSFESVLVTGVGIVVGIIVATLLAPTGPAGSAIGAKIAGGLAGAGTAALLKNIAGVESLGQKQAARLAVGAQDFTLAGAGGGGVVTLSDDSVETSEFNLDCVIGKARGTVPTDPVDPDAAVAGIYPGILDALALVPTIDREGSSGGSPDAGIEYLRRVANDTLVSLAEVAAVYFVYQDQVGIAGASDALPLLAAARVHHAAGEYVLAVEDYREAFRVAYTAMYNGNFGAGYTPPSHLTMVGPTKMGAQDSHIEFMGWAQGLSPTEYIDFVDVEGQDSGMEFFSFPGVARTGLVLAADLGPGLEESSIIGLGRTSAGVVRGADVDCDYSHLEEGSIGGGIFIDDQGPYFEPDPGGCGYGEVVETYVDVWGGGVPLGSGPDIDGIFTLALDMSDELLPGEYPLTVTAYIMDSNGGGTRDISAPITLLVWPESNLFADGFESSDVSQWSSSTP